MVLRMSHPRKHPESGIYWFRKRVPAWLRPLIGKTEEKISLRTRDPEEAKFEFARVNLEVQQRWRELAAGVRRLSEKQAAGIAGKIYRSMVEEHQDNPSRVPWGTTHLLLHRSALKKEKVRIIPLGDPAKSTAMVEKIHQNRNRETRGRIDDWLKARGLLLEADSRMLVEKAVDRAMLDAREYIARMADGDYSPDPAAARYPPLSLEEKRADAAPGGRAPVTFDEIIDARAAKRQAGKNSKPLPSTSIQKYKRLCREFAAFRKSDDATTTTLAEAEEWGDAMLEAAKLDNRTIADRLIGIGTVINWGRRMKQFRKAMAAAEILSGQIELPEWSGKPADETSYTLDEARHVLSKARDADDPRTRWLPWLCLYAGLRISEANALRKSDFFECEGRWFFRVTSRGGRKLKTPRSERKMPVHPALEREGLLHWVAAASTDRLFAPGATSFVGRWVRSDAVGITRDEISPIHGLRHLFVALCRRDRVQDEPREYLCGHASSSVHRKYGASDVMLPGLAAELDKVKPLLPSPMDRAA